ncbi:MAG: helix-turn-helix domain-containing protein, partial [Microbacterium sp.]|nr:helix-turn-helix domain-containing protein [Microbacterium sp.]
MAEDAGMLARTMRVLGCFSEDEPAVTAAEIAARTGLPTSTVHRLLADLVGHGLLA